MSEFDSLIESYERSKKNILLINEMAGRNLDAAGGIRLNKLTVLHETTKKGMSAITEIAVNSIDMAGRNLRFVEVCREEMMKLAAVYDSSHEKVKAERDAATAELAEVKAERDAATAALTVERSENGARKRKIIEMKGEITAARTAHPKRRRGENSISARYNLRSRTNNMSV